jgi:limonene-1,2-epoxide hydrolase
MSSNAEGAVAARRKRNTIGLHVLLVCSQPDAVDVLHERYDQLLDALSWTNTAVVAVAKTKVKHS